MLSPFRSFGRPTSLVAGLLFSVTPAFVGESSAGEALKDSRDTLGPNAVALSRGTIAGWIVENQARGELTRVDLALVLAIDVSRSITAEEHRLQLGGYATAFRSRAVLD